MPDRIASTFASRFRRPVLDFDPPAVERPGRLRRLWSILPIGVAFGLFGAVVWLAYQDAGLEPPTGEPPLIRAAPDPIKLRPDETDDSALAAEQGTVGRLWSDADQLDAPERLLPRPEAPLSPPAPEEPATAEATTGQPAEQPAAEGGAPETATAVPAPPAAGQKEDDGGVAAAPDESTSPAQAVAAPPATDESVREAEAALDRLLAEVTAMSEGTDLPAGPADRQASAEPSPEQQAGPASEPPPAVASVPRSAAPAATPVPERPAPAPQPQVRPAGATTAPPAPAAQPSERPTETAALSESGLRTQIAPGGGFRIQLAAVRGEADARRAWQLFQGDLGPVLAGVEPIFERADTANGVFYRVQVGPFASEEAAESLCEQLKERNASCFVIRR